MPEIRSLIEQNRGAVERLANVERLTFVESRWQSCRGALAPRVRVHVVYEKKIDVAAERNA